MSTFSDGFLISNDKERDMFRWHQSTNVAFTHEDPSTFPDLYTTEEVCLSGVFNKSCNLYRVCIDVNSVLFVSDLHVHKIHCLRYLKLI